MPIIIQKIMNLSICSDGIISFGLSTWDFQHRSSMRFQMKNVSLYLSQKLQKVVNLMLYPLLFGLGICLGLLIRLQDSTSRASGTNQKSSSPQPKHNN